MIVFHADYLFLIAIIKSKTALAPSTKIFISEESIFSNRIALSGISIYVIAYDYSN